MSLRPLCLLALATACTAQTLAPADMAPGPAKVPKQQISFDLSSIDKTADPCTNFYQYSCGNWIKQNPIPPDRTRWSRFDELGERSNYLLYLDLKAAADAPKSPLQTKYGDFFATCMNVDLANRLGSRPIDPALKAIASWAESPAQLDPKALAGLVISMQQSFGTGLFFDFGSDQDQKNSSIQIGEVDQGGLSLPDRDFYVVKSDRMEKIRTAYVAHVTKMFTLLGDSPEAAAAEAKAVMSIETALAQGSMTRVSRRNPADIYHVMTIDALEAETPAFSWKTYLDGQGEGSLQTVNVVAPDFFKALNAQLTTASVPALTSYMRWHVVHTFAPNLSEPFVSENFDFFRKTIAGQKEQTPRWRLCTQATDRALGEAVGQDWVKQNFPPAAKDNMEKLVHALEAAMATDIQQLPWMSDATKAEAEKKLAAFRDKIGYPDTWRNYDTLAVKRDDLVGNAARATEFLERRDIDKIGKPVNEREWSMSPPTVNAYYNPAQNDINFPAGILQPPFYSFSADPAVNFGGIGVVIGHEMTHGFDDEGAKYDLNGNVRTWWTPEDTKAFNERTECTAKEYDNFEVAPGQKLNGHLTLGENTADNGGLRLAFRALQATLKEQGNAGAGFVNGKEDGFTPDQRFFIAFGQVWCTSQTEQESRLRAVTDPHSTGQWRTNGSVQNFEEFGKAFGCKVGSPMRPENVCRTW